MSLALLAAFAVTIPAAGADDAASGGSVPAVSALDEYCQIQDPVKPASGQDDFSFSNAMKSFASGDLETLKNVSKTACSSLESMNRSVATESLTLLDCACRALGKLCADLESGSTVSEKTLKVIYASTCLALAKNSFYRAVEYWAARDTEKTGRSLREGAAYITETYMWLGRGFDPATRESVGSIALRARDLEAAADWDEDKATQALLDEGSEMDRFGIFLHAPVPHPHSTYLQSLAHPGD